MISTSSLHSKQASAARLRHSRITLYALLVALAVLTAFPFGSAHAQESTPSDDEVNAIASQLYCPVCENTPLDVCPTEACRQWRELIRQQLADGWTEEQIKQYFVDNYGARVLAAPPPTGLNWLFYVLPPVIILAGALLLYRKLRNWNRGASPSAAATPTPTDDDYAARFEEELKRRT